MVSLPPEALLADVYRHMPFLVIHVTTDGIVLHCNPETLRVTGFGDSELVGQNFWATLFPGKLFAQVPRFISLIEPSALLKDMPMTIRTKSGAERIISFSRYLHTNVNLGGGEYDCTPRSFICIGVDLTDRLLDSDRAQVPESDRGAAIAFGPHIGNAGSIDSEIVTPIAISPRPPGTTGPCPIEQVREGLAKVETHIHCVQGAFDEGEMQTLTAFAGVLHGDGLGSAGGAGGGGMRENQLAYEMLALGEQLHLRACWQTLGSIRARVDELLALHPPELP